MIPEVESDVLVTDVSISHESILLDVDSTAVLTALVLPGNASNKDVTWSSLNTAIATVSSTGVVTGKAVGTATITATSKDGSNKSGSCTVTVNPVQVSSVSVTPSATSVNVDSTTTLFEIVLPSNAANRTVTWSSSNTAIATVSSSGVVTGKSVGNATITATSKDGSNKSGSCTVTVKAVEKLLLGGSSIGTTWTLTPSNGINIYQNDNNRKYSYGTSYLEFASGVASITLESGLIDFTGYSKISITGTLEVSSNAPGFGGACQIFVGNSRLLGNTLSSTNNPASLTLNNTMLDLTGISGSQSIKIDTGGSCGGPPDSNASMSVLLDITNVKLIP